MLSSLLLLLLRRAAQSNIPAERVASDMDRDRSHKKQQVATYIKEIGKLRANRKRGE